MYFDISNISYQPCMIYLHPKRTSFTKVLDPWGKPIYADWPDPGQVNRHTYHTHDIQ